jgi:protein-disulfide isomerase
MMSKSPKISRIERRKQQQRQKQLRAVGMMMIGIVVIAVAVLVLSNAGKSVAALIDPQLNEHPEANMNALGDPNAPVVVEEFSSFKCSHCYNFFTESEQLFIQNYVKTGLVYYVYKPYHLDVDRIETQGSHAAMCAGEQGAFWDFHDMLFTNYSIPYTASNLDDIAEYFDLDLDAFEECHDSGKYYDQILQDTENAYLDLEITGTPTFVINGEVAIVGNEGYQALAQAVETALASVQSE